MLKRTIQFTDFNDEACSEVHYFNLNKTELLETDFGYSGGLEKTLSKIIETQDRGELVKIFKSLILSAYGEKSVDGKRFMKSEQLRDEFSHSAAFEALFTELATNDKAAADFIKGILPKDMEEIIKAHEAQEAINKAADEGVAKENLTTGQLAEQIRQQEAQ